MFAPYKYIRVLFLILFISVKAIAAQLAMPDSVYTGTAKQYFVDPTPGSTYIWKIDGVIQPSVTTHLIDIVWNTSGTHLLEVQELNASTCAGDIQSGLIVVRQLLEVIPSADLSVLKTVDHAHPIIGQTVQFTIVATNHGTSNATFVTVTDFLLNGYTYVSSIASKGTFDSFLSVWTIGPLASGESENLTIKATINELGDYSNTATIDGLESDSISENNTTTTITFPTDFFIPEGFSPNGDGINDFFVIRGIANYPKNTIAIFNRWGNKVFEASPYQNTWDGRSMFGVRVGGDELPIGTYFYVLDVGDGSATYKGTIYLNR